MPLEPCTLNERILHLQHALNDAQTDLAMQALMTTQQKNSINAAATTAASLLAKVPQTKAASDGPGPLGAGSVYTLTTTPERYTFDDGAGHQYIIHRHPTHFHAEECFAWGLDGMLRATPEGVRDWFRGWRESLGDTVVTA